MIKVEPTKTFLSYRQEIIFVRILIPYSLGILLFYSFAGLTLMWWCLFFCLLLFTLLTLLNLFYNRLNAYKFKSSTGLAFSFFWFTFGGYCCLSRYELLQTSHFSNNPTSYLKVCIVDEPQIKNKTVSFRAAVIEGYQSHPAKVNSRHLRELTGKLIISGPVELQNNFKFQFGDRLLIKAIIKSIDTPRYPADFDYRFSLATQNIYHRVFLRQKNVVKLRPTSRFDLQKRAIELRAKQIAFLRTILNDDTSYAFASALILGYKSDLNKGVMEIYSQTGTIHALSVSGMHVGIVYLVLNWLLSFMNKTKWTILIKVALMLSFIWFYAFVTGFSPAILRSAIMLSVYIVAKLFSRHTNSYNIISFAAFCLLIHNPLLIWDIGFQLSFIAVFGLIWLHPLILNWWRPSNSWLYKIWNAVAVSLSAQLITCPLSIYYFHQFPVYFLMSNLFILIPIAMLMYIGIAMMVFRIEALGQLFELIVNFTNDGLKLIANLPANNISGIYFSRTELILLYTSLFTLAIALTYYNKKQLFIGMTLFLVFQSLVSYNHLIGWFDKRAAHFKQSCIP